MSRARARLVPLVATVLLVVLSASGALAQATDRREELVYVARLSDGRTVREALAPRAAPRLYLLAGVAHALEPRRTMVYYWPLTHTYKADTSVLNEPVAGRLEVTASDGAVRRLDPRPYLIEWPEGAAGEVSRVVTDDVDARYERFREESNAYQTALIRYHEARASFEVAHAAYIEAIKRGERPPRPTEPPPPPEVRRFLSVPADGFVLDLAPGEYRVRLVDGTGQPVAGSQRDVTVVEPRRRGVSYRVVAEDRWTAPSQADPVVSIFARPGGTLYLEPFGADEVDDVAAKKLVDPQDDSGQSNRWRWLQREALAGTLEVEGGGPIRLERVGYVVQQLPGATLGYRIVPVEQADGAAADFDAYRVEVPPSSQTLRIRLLDERGAPVPGSEREIRAVAGGLTSPIGLLVLAPIVGWFVLAAVRRRRTVLRTPGA